MIVDDSASTVLTLAEVLKHRYRLLTAHSASEALDLLKTNQPDIILLDIIMPGINGYEVLSLLKKNQKTHHIPVIFITSRSDEADEEKGFELGAVDYIIKPVTPSLVHARIRTQLDLKKYRDHLESIVEKRTRQLQDLNAKLHHEMLEHRKTTIKLRESEAGYRAFSRVGLALTKEKNISKLLEMILTQARNLSNADAGTLYILNDAFLCFEIIQNDTIEFETKGDNIDKSQLPRVPLYVDGKPNFANVSSYAALTGKKINISDVYQETYFDFSGTKKYDQRTGYRSKSMLVIPMKNHENKMIGVLQLINACDKETGDIVYFSKIHEDLVASLASQASVALTKTQLIDDLKGAFYAFIKSIAVAVDEKSPFTGGHIKRVVDITMSIAYAINDSTDGPYQFQHFTEDELEELRLAAWMHDIGKITSPEYIIDKNSRLHSLLDRIQLIKMRFQLIKKIKEIEYLNQIVQIQMTNQLIDEQIEVIKQNLKTELLDIEKKSALIQKFNQIEEFIDHDKITQLEKIAHHTYKIDGKTYPYLSNDELINLCIPKGTLNQNERSMVENHVKVTAKILQQIPFPTSLSKVPQFASEHHERNDGSGYFKGLTKEELSLQSRIIAFADIFEALTAKDRPYKKPVELEMAVQILKDLKKNDKIDPDIFDLFIKIGLHQKFATPEES